MHESSCLRTSFRSQSVNGSQTLMKPARQDLYTKFLLISKKWSWKRSVLVRSEILGLFLTRWRSITCFLVRIEINSDNKLKHNYLQNQKHFLAYFAFLNSTSNLVHFQKTFQFHGLNIFEVIDSKRCGYWIPWNSCLRAHFDSECVNGSQTLLKTARAHF